MKLLITKFLYAVLLFLAVNSSQAQDKANAGENLNIKFSMYAFVGGGISAGISAGISKNIRTAKDVEVMQLAMNTSYIIALGRNHLGNNGRKGNRVIRNLVFSPILTTSFHWKDSSRTGIYEEVNPMYLNNTSSIYSNFRSSLSAGTSFVVLPRGFGRNYITSRNRSQQLSFFQLKGGWGKYKSLQMNLVEDVWPFFLADKWDRYFTGGGSIQLRYNNFKAKVYSEVYTGTTNRDMMDYPDITVARDSTGTNGKLKWLKGVKREMLYTSQEASQKTFNTGRTVYALEVDNKLFNNNSPFVNKFSHNFYFFTQGGPDMWSQNLIHSMGTGDIQKVIPKKDGSIPFKVKGDKNKLMPKHFFEPQYTNRIKSFGYGINYLFNRAI